MYIPIFTHVSEKGGLGRRCLNCAVFAVVNGQDALDGAAVVFGEDPGWHAEFLQLP